MQVGFHTTGTMATLRWEPAPDDVLVRERDRLAARSASFELPVALAVDDLHPDIVALLALLAVGPFSMAIQLERGVSPAFSDAARRSGQPPLTPVDPALAPRQAPRGGRVGLAFSAGADSSAALAVLPEGSLACFMDRFDRPEGARGRPYSAGAPRHAVRELASRGLPVIAVRTDIVYAREPIGFLTGGTNASPLLLLADVEGLDAIAWGSIAESTYHIGHEQFFDWGSHHQTGWAPMFAAVDLPRCLPVGGVSEVGTSMIVRAWDHGDVVQSCQIGEPGVPCRRCWKCFRKLLLDAALSGHWPTDDEVDGMLRGRHVRAILTQYPIKHENVVAWLLRDYGGSHPVLRHLVDRTRARTLDLDWMTRAYPPSFAAMPARHRDAVEAGVYRHLEPMSLAQQAVMEAWDMTAFLADPATRASHDHLVAMLAPYASWSTAAAPDRRHRLARLAAGIRRRLPG
jgi:hypothetical protein